MRRIIAVSILILLIISQLFADPLIGEHTSDTLHLTAYKNAPPSAVLNYEIKISNKKADNIPLFTNNSYLMELVDFDSNQLVFDNALKIEIGMNSIFPIHVSVQVTSLLKDGTDYGAIKLIWRVTDYGPELPQGQSWLDSYRSDGSTANSQGEPVPFSDGNGHLFRYKLAVTPSVTEITASQQERPTISLTFSPVAQKCDIDDTGNWADVNWEDERAGGYTSDVLPGFYEDCPDKLRASATFSLSLPNKDNKYTRLTWNTRYHCNVNVTIEGE